MKYIKDCHIENTITALQEAIENKKVQMQRVKVQSGPSPALSHLFSEISNRAGGSYAQMAKSLEHGGEFVQDFIKTVQQNIKDKPWEVLRKVAVYSFATGLFFSLRHRKSPTREKE